MNTTKLWMDVGIFVSHSRFESNAKEKFVPFWLLDRLFYSQSNVNKRNTASIPKCYTSNAFRQTICEFRWPRKLNRIRWLLGRLVNQWFNHILQNLGPLWIRVIVGYAIWYTCYLANILWRWCGIWRLKR